MGPRALFSERRCNSRQPKDRSVGVIVVVREHRGYPMKLVKQLEAVRVAMKSLEALNK